MSVKNLHDGIKNKGYHDIPDCGRDDLPQFFKELGLSVGAEIGVYKGGFTKKFLDVGHKMYGIDPWAAYGEYSGKFHEVSKRHWPASKLQERQNFLYGHTKRYLKEYIDSGKCNLIRKTSMDAVKDFSDGTLDFVYIDGHHGLKYIVEDIWEWSKKVRRGGIISGHDYHVSKHKPRDPYVIHVRYGVDAFLKAFMIPNFYVLGRRKYIEGEQKDKWRSWMFFKE